MCSLLLGSIGGYAREYLVRWSISTSKSEVDNNERDSGNLEKWFKKSKANRLQYILVDNFEPCKVLPISMNSSSCSSMRPYSNLHEVHQMQLLLLTFLQGKKRQWNYFLNSLTLFPHLRTYTHTIDLGKFQPELSLTVSLYQVISIRLCVIIQTVKESNVSGTWFHGCMRSLYFWYI